MTLVQLLQRFRPTRELVFTMGKPRAIDTLGHYQKLISHKERILDVGAGTCNVALLMQDNGYDVTPLDVADLSFTPRMKPVLYDGAHMPFKKKEFDTALILTVLHHVPAAQHETVLRETARVAKRIIIIEDVHNSTLHKYLTMFMDSLFNLEFIGHPHSNKSDAQWRDVFQRLGWKLSKVQAMQSFGVLRHRMYVLEVG
ncbi:MAG TPA: class I SAM-dependent methyltransferase [Candidatus Saccharimonadales bacterium]|nr:class I SAM-dependent methyltransferase [Candidatus Saccharimonadales bacterium]